MAKLQLALDCIGMEEAVDLVRSLEKEIDILRIWQNRYFLKKKSIFLRPERPF